MSEGNGQPAFEFRQTACPVCAADEPRHVGWRGGAAHHGGSGVRTAIVRCRRCSHLYPNPMPYPRGGLDALYTDAEVYFNNHDVEQKKAGGRALLRGVAARLGRAGRFLDIGCGRGELLWAARAEGWECEGVDTSSAYLEWARTHLGVEGRHGTLESVRFPDEHFDAIAMSSVLEHLYDPFATLMEVRRVLRPGGIFWFDAPNELGLYMRVGNLYMKLLGRDWCVNLAPTFPPYHVQGFNPQSLRTLLARAGLKLERLDVAGGIWPLTGRPSLRKRVEYNAARLVSWLGNRSGAGSYMEAWARKPEP